MTSQDRHAKLGQMVLRLFPKVMQMVLKDNIKPAALKNKYKKRAINVNLNNSEVTLMENLPKIDDFTIQLCYKILRYEDLLDKPKREWGETPHDSDTEISDDVQRLLCGTNELLNKQSGDITDDYFKEFIGKITKLIARVDIVLQSDQCDQLFRSLYTDKINSSDYLQELLRMTPIEMTTNTPPCIMKIKAREHYSRISMVITGILPNILRAVIKTHISPRQIYKQHCLPILKTVFQTHEQNALKNLKTAHNYDSVDIPLIYRLLRQFALIVTPTKGWGKKPEVNHVTISDDVERIRILRNEIAHLSNTRIDRPTFEDYFSQFCDIGHRVDLYFRSTTSYKQDIIECITCVLDSDQHIRYEDALKRIENIKCQFETKPVIFYWGDSFETSWRNLQSMLKNGKAEGKKIAQIEIVVHTEEEMDQAPKILQLNEIKAEINQDLKNIRFLKAYEKCIVLCVQVVIEIFETKEKLLSTLVLFMEKILKNGNFEICDTESIDAVLVFKEDTETTEADKRSTAYKEYTDTEMAEADKRSTSSSFYLTFEAESFIFESDERMRSELGETVKSVLKHANGNGRKHDITATLFPFHLESTDIDETEDTVKTKGTDSKYQPDEKVEEVIPAEIGWKDTETNEWLAGTNLESLNRQHMHRHLKEKQHNEKENPSRRRRRRRNDWEYLSNSMDDFNQSDSFHKNCDMLTSSQSSLTDSSDESNTDNSNTDHTDLMNSDMFSDSECFSRNSISNMSDSDFSLSECEYDSGYESYYEKSYKIFSQQVEDPIFKESEMLKNGIQLSTNCIQSITSEIKTKNFKNFYKQIKDRPRLVTLLSDSQTGESYRKCILHIENSHSANCTVVNPIDNIRTIYISGRSKCGQAYSDDVVLVKILKREGQDYQTKPVVYGEVVGILSSKRFGKEQKPVLVCELDKFENDKAIPFCKTVPKIHLYKTKTDNSSPFVVEIFAYNSKHQTLDSKRTIQVNQSMKRKNVFFVTIIDWLGLYPLGVVIAVQKSSQAVQDGIKLLQHQYSVPTFYKKETVKAIPKIIESSVEHIIEKDQRLNLTNLNVFSIKKSELPYIENCLSIENYAEGFKVGVHIADVSVYIEKGDSVDKEACERAKTFNPGQGTNSYHLLPEPLAAKCSLVENETRLAISFFMYINRDFVCQKFDMVKSLIRSSRTFTYSEAEEAIDYASTNKEDAFSNALDMLFKIAHKMQHKRLGDAVCAVSIENDFFINAKSSKETTKTRCLVDEFILLTNSVACRKLVSVYPECVPMVCQDPPSAKNVMEWLRSYPQICNLIGHLQQTKVLPNKKLSVNHICRKIRYNAVHRVQKWVWTKFKKCMNMVGNNGLAEIPIILGQDYLHPMQALALDEWHSFQKSTLYRCSGKAESPASDELKQFSLTNCKTPFPNQLHITSPITRFVDILAHRLCHAALNETIAPYNSDEVAELCHSMNKGEKQARLFATKCKQLHLAYELLRNPIFVHGFVQTVSDREMILFIPGLSWLSIECRKICFNLLQVFSCPEVIECREDLCFNVEKDTVVLKWKRRVYSTDGKPPKPKDDNKGYQVTPTKYGPFQRLDPHQRITAQKLINWCTLLKTMLYRLERLPSEFRHMDNTDISQYIPTTVETEYDINSELSFRRKSSNEYDKTKRLQKKAKTNVVVIDQYCNFTMSFSHGQIIAVQLSSEFEKGILTPKPQLFDMTGNIKFCLQHISDPVQCFEYYSSVKTSPKYDSEKQYQQVWLPIVRMESVTAATKESPIVINNLPIQFEENGGYFPLMSYFCEERNIILNEIINEFDYGDKDLKNPERTKSLPVSDYLCIKCAISKENNHFTPNEDSNPVDYRYLIIHSKIDKIKTLQIGKSKETTYVHFTKIPSPQKIPEQLVTNRENVLCSVDFIQIPDTDKRIMWYLRQLDTASELAKSIAVGHDQKLLPNLDDCHLQAIQDVVDVPQDILFPNNASQEKAIRKALNSSFSLIHGPPGTGKTYTALKLIYLFERINSTLANGNKGKIVFCGPSNKSVDLVTKLFHEKFGKLKFARLYGGAIENRDFPVPGRVFSTRSGGKDFKVDGQLQCVAVHHMIRESHRPLAEQILKYDEMFNRNPNRVAPKSIKKYTKLVIAASVDVVKEQDIIFCTTSMATSIKLVAGGGDNIFQCIIDEAGMCTEPECIATIIATKAKQVVLIGDHKQLQPITLCRDAAKLGLETSLFQRYGYNSVQLNRQYRMHESICEFPSKTFYDNSLKTETEEDDYALEIWRNPNQRHIFYHVEGTETILPVNTEVGNEKSRSNQKEVEQVIKVFEKLVHQIPGDRKAKISAIKIMSQYNSQCSAIRNALAEKTYTDVNVDTVVACQGGQWDYVIFSLVRSLPKYRIEPRPTRGWCIHNLGFITDEHQMTVALTRAKKGLFIIGNKNLLQCDSNWRNLIESYGSKGCVEFVEEV